MLFRALDEFLSGVWSNKFRFFGVFMMVTILSYGFLYAIDFIPEAPEESNGGTALEDRELEDHEPAEKPEDATPDKLIIDALDREVDILNPTSAAIENLDNALLSGAVRHPDSADLIDEGTMFLFGHSSSLPVIHNQNFKAFNGIEDLSWGDTIRVQSSDFEYVYRVDRVYEAKASEASVEIIRGQARLTLATCNSFGSKDDRYIVEASLIDSYPL